MPTTAGPPASRLIIRQSLEVPRQERLVTRSKSRMRFAPPFPKDAREEWILAAGLATRSLARAPPRSISQSAVQLAFFSNHQPRDPIKPSPQAHSKIRPRRFPLSSFSQTSWANPSWVQPRSSQFHLLVKPIPLSRWLPGRKPGNRRYHQPRTERRRSGKINRPFPRPPVLVPARLTSYF